jgi:glycosyltransferase involved in cell wall biosynthesis
MSAGNIEDHLKVSVIVPTFNEGPNVRKVLRDIVANLKYIDKWEILVVDDSSDLTHDILKELASVEPRIRVIHRDKERGFGSAIRVGLSNSRGEIIIVIMGDGSDDPAFISQFIEKMQEGYDIVIGSRFGVGSKITGYPVTKYLANRAFNIIAKTMFSLKTNDLSNAFKAYRRRVVETITTESDGFEISPELTLKAIKSGYKYCDIPVTWDNRKFGEAKFRVTASAIPYFKLVLRLLFKR